MSEEATPAAGWEGRKALVVYILLIAALMAIGIFTIPIAIVMACLGFFRRSTPQWVRTHYSFQLRNVLVFVLSIATVFVMLPGVDGGVTWAGYVMLAGVIGLVLYIARCFGGLVILYRHKPIPAWLV